jgi:hypothetical protein
LSVNSPTSGVKETDNHYISMLLYVAQAFGW